MAGKDLFKRLKEGSDPDNASEWKYRTEITGGLDRDYIEDIDFVLHKIFGRHYQFGGRNSGKLTVVSFNPPNMKEVEKFNKETPNSLQLKVVSESSTDLFKRLKETTKDSIREMEIKGNEIVLSKEEQDALQQVYKETEGWKEGFDTWDHRVKRFLELTKKVREGEIVPVDTRLKMLAIEQLSKEGKQPDDYSDEEWDRLVIDTAKKLHRAGATDEGKFVSGFLVKHENIGGVLAQEFFKDKTDAQQWLAKAVILAEPGDKFTMEESESEQ